jgi:prepilin signal peptidase PulO-like enzyme (type II secretory pathway)
MTAVYAIFVGFLLAGAAVVVMLAARRITRKDRLAMGPFMLLGALAAILLFK